MSTATTRSRVISTAAGAMALALVMGGVAHAGIILSTPDASFATSPISIALGSGTFTFTGIPNTFPGNPPAEVSTAGSARVATLIGVTDFSSGASIDQNNELYSFAPYHTPTIIPDSAADDFIGLAFTNSTGLHFGYAQVDGAELVSYAYESTPNTTILTGAVPAPEPMTVAILLSGLAALACVKRHRRNPAED